jgi:hypothetical protein
MNPARTFGPDLVATDFTSYLVYVAGPLVGAVLAVGAAWVLRGAGGGRAGSSSTRRRDEGAGIHKVVWTSNKPYGVGTTRTVWLALVTADEYFFRWEQNRRFSFYLTGHSMPFFHAFAEDYLLEEVAPGRTQFLQRGDRAPLDGQDRRPDCTNILRFAVQERLQRSAKLRPERRGLLVGRRRGAMKECGAPYR